MKVIIFELVKVGEWGKWPLVVYFPVPTSRSEKVTVLVAGPAFSALGGSWPKRMTGAVQL